MEKKLSTVSFFERGNTRENFIRISPSIISFFLLMMIFSSRLAISVRAISLVISLALILVTVSPKDLLQTYIHHPIARAAALLYACFIIGAFYSEVSLDDRLHTLKIYSPLLWIGFLITFFQTSFPNLPSQLRENKIHTYITVFIGSIVLITFLGCLNAWHIVNVTELIHSHLLTDPPEYPFGNFSLSLCFAAYLSAQKMKGARTKKMHIAYLAIFIFLTFFIFYINHLRTAYILYSILMLLYGYQHLGLKGVIGAALALSCLTYSANHTSETFHQRTTEAVHDVKIYQQGNPISSTGLRLFFIKESVHLWEKRPLFGYGTGSFKSTYLTIDGYNVTGQKNTPETALDQPHNDYAFILVQLGLFGFIFLLWLLFQQIFYSFQLPRFEKQCAQAFILCFMVGSLDTTLFFYTTSMTVYFFFTALFYAVLYKKPIKNKPKHWESN